MRRLLGIVLVLLGVSGAIDQLVGQPFMGVVLNLFNRLVVERFEVFQGYEVVANLGLAAIGCLLLVVAPRRV
ncbi:hypothetical protein ACIBG8_01965 [Nonomuraea sp. NPDC050556]|uniref:hypothetical protein n=1 Tax=Nonomuraea sp. NPDC050556 TaxID=3364369 RepID=UPI00379DC5B4